jgi:hypothetical protein
MDLSPGWLERAVREGLAKQRRPMPNEATTRATDDARMRNKVKAAAERAGTLRRRAHAAQERERVDETETALAIRRGGDRQ